MFAISDVILTKFLPDGNKASFVSYIDLLIDIINTKSGKTNITKLPTFLPPLIKEELYAKYDVYLRSLTDSSITKKKLAKYNIYPSSSHGFYIIMDSARGTEGPIYISLTKIPKITISSKRHLSCNSFRCKSSIRKALEDELVRGLEKGIADIFELGGIYLESNGSEKETLLGKPSWIYLHEKILEFKVLHQLYTQEKSQSSPSLVYEFAKQSSVVFLSIGMPYIKLKLPDLINGPNLEIEQKTKEDLYVVRNQIIEEFLIKCDQILLKAWGNEKFSKMLEPLNVSLEEWLKASKNLVCSRNLW